MFRKIRDTALAPPLASTAETKAGAFSCPRLAQQSRPQAELDRSPSTGAAQLLIPNHYHEQKHNSRLHPGFPELRLVSHACPPCFAQKPQMSFCKPPSKSPDTSRKHHCLACAARSSGKLLASGSTDLGRCTTKHWWYLNYQLSGTRGWKIAINGASSYLATDHCSSALNSLRLPGHPLVGSCISTRVPEEPSRTAASEAAMPQVSEVKICWSLWALGMGCLHEEGCPFWGVLIMRTLLCVGLCCSHFGWG